VPARQERPRAAQQDSRKQNEVTSLVGRAAARGYAGSRAHDASAAGTARAALQRTIESMLARCYPRALLVTEQNDRRSRSQGAEFANAAAGQDERTSEGRLPRTRFLAGA
jgi:hypothetical protein